MSYLQTYNRLLWHIRYNKPFSFSRWGDGEMNSVIGSRIHQKNCDKHTFFPEMGAQLKQILLSKPKYMMGLLNLNRYIYTVGPPGTPWKRAKEILGPFLRRNGLVNYPWYSAEVFYNAATNNNLHPLIRSLNRRNVIMVGPQHLTQMQTINVQHHVTIPTVDCFLSVDEIYSNITTILDSQPEHNFVVSLSAGMPSCILIDRLHKSHGNLHSFVDFGSVWDPFVGVLSRRYMRNK